MAAGSGRRVACCLWGVVLMVDGQGRALGSGPIPDASASVSK